MNPEKRTYNNKLRSQKADATGQRVILSFGDLWTKHSINDITLEMIADASKVSTRTILRKFGSREGLLEEALDKLTPQFMAEREKNIGKDVYVSLKMLLNSYELMGDAAIRTINLEAELDIAKRIGEMGRRAHREWCAEVFKESLSPPGTDEYETQLLAFITSTEIYLWKLLRRDLKKSEKETYEIFKRMIDGLISLANVNSHE